jgi:flagellar capping protein FliD
MTSDPAGVAELLAGFSASATLEAGGTGSIVSISGTPTAATDSGTYELTSDPSTGTITIAYQPDGGGTLQVSTVTVSPGEVNTTIIPGVAITFSDPLVLGTDTIRIGATQEGVAKALHEYVDAFARSGGLLENRQDEFSGQIENINDHIERLELRIDARRDQLIRRFAQLEVTMQRLQSQQSALNQLFTQLQALNSRS